MRAGDGPDGKNSCTTALFQSAPAPMRAGDAFGSGLAALDLVSIRAGSHESRRRRRARSVWRSTCFNPRRLP